jgi:hypothetical protein
MTSSSLALVGGTLAVNLLLFILGAQFLFLGPIHHHWVFPFEALLLGAQYAYFSRRGLKPARITILFLLGLLFLVAVLRWETIHTCIDHCVPKVAWAIFIALLSLGLGCLLKKQPRTF